MDEPIIYCLPTSRLQFLIKPAMLVTDKFHNALILDNKDEFLSLFKDPEMEQFEGVEQILLAPFNVHRIFEEDASQIAMALINGDTKGYIEDDYLVFEDGWTPLHLASVAPSPKLIKCLIQRGDPVHAPCDYKPLNLKQATPLDLALEVIDSGYQYGLHLTNRPWSLRCSIFELFYYVCHYRKQCLEVIRLLVKNTENKERVRKAFIDSANDGKFIKVAALFLAAPELFLSTSLGGDNMSSIDKLYLNLNSLDKTTDIQDGLLLLLDVFDLIGDMLIAYVRQNDEKVWNLSRYNSISFFLLEAAHKKLGISSHDDYLLSLFKPVSQHAAEPPCLPHPNYGDNTAFHVSNVWYMLPFMKKEDIDIDYVNREIPRLEPHEADGLRKVIDNKLSIMPNIRALFENTTRMANEGREQRSSFPHPRSIVEPWMRSFHTEAAIVKGRLDVRLFSRNGWKSQVMNPTKVSSFMSAARLSGFHIIRRLVK